MKTNLLEIIVLCIYEIRLNLFTIGITLGLFSLYLITIPIFLGLWPEVLLQFHLGILWTCLLISFLPEQLLKVDLQDGTLEFYFLSTFPLQSILFFKLFANWLLKISGILLGYPLLGFFYHYVPSSITCCSLILGSFIFMLISGVHSTLTLGAQRSKKHDLKSLQYLTTLPTVLPLIMLCTYIQTKMFHLFFLIGYLTLFVLIYSILIRMTLRHILSQ